MPGSYHIPVIFVSIIILISFLSTAISVQSISNSDDACTVLNSSVSEKIIPRISISTDTQQYSPGQVVEIFGNVTDSKSGKPVNETLNLNILDPSRKSIGGEQTCTLGGKFGYNLTNTQQGGTYTIIASTKDSTVNTTISVLDFLSINPMTIIPILVSVAGLAFGVGLVVVLLWLPYAVVRELTKSKWIKTESNESKNKTEKRIELRKEHWWCWSKKKMTENPSSVAGLLAERSLKDLEGRSKYSFSERCDLTEWRRQLANAHHELDEVERNLKWGETLRFICISGMVISVIILYFFTPVELGINSSLGLVKLHDANNNHSIEWVLNIGGTRETNYAGGLHIPLYVFVFGILGGYLRYLYSTAYPGIDDEVSNLSLKKEEISKKEEIFSEIDRDEKETNEFLTKTLKQLALIFLAPLLAIAVWFVVSGQGQTNTNVTILAALSLAIGLVTKEVVNGLISFAKGRIPSTTTPSITTLIPSQEEKLSTIKVQTLLDKFPSTRYPTRVKLTDPINNVLAAFCNSDENMTLTDVIVVDKDDKPIGILYLSELLSVLGSLSKTEKCKLEKSDTEGVLQLWQKIDEINNHLLIPKKKWTGDEENRTIDNFAKVTPDDDLLRARERMYALSTQVNDVRNVVTDPKTGKAIGVFSYDSIAAFMKS